MWCLQMSDEGIATLGTVVAVVVSHHMYAMNLTPRKSNSKQLGQLSIPTYLKDEVEKWL